ncbi:metalloregulator ArsR/SmtB family transcription factor [Shewanella sp. KX20019]|uniref:metalloregulator ArsR/SmtB family transcription factor n=1 Tax=Shewanella sp. KX20019 TaxID=2803864 RepID=UPI001925A29D|nr:metalloregulator ArsR/SmtB family transcription factor [Shewanella sp. KX20019]QQX79696.1 metalloregulator ArsR/SmtB family transcription factor [Shewanella sp. KX20019]
MTPLAFFKALADDTRLRSLLLIQSESELCVCELMTALDEIQPKISRHLAQLRKLGLLVDRRQGQWVFYRINPELPLWANDILQTLASQQPQLIETNLAMLLQMGERPERVLSCC